MSFAAVISNCSSFAVQALRFARLALMLLTEFSMMTSLLSLSSIDFSCSEIVPILSSASITSSASLSRLKELESLSFFASGDVEIFHRNWPRICFCIF